MEIGILLRVCGERGEVVVGPGVDARTVQGVGGGADGVRTLFGVVEEWRVGGVGCGGLAKRTRAQWVVRGGGSCCGSGGGLLDCGSLPVSLGFDFDFVFFFFFWRRGERCAVGL